MYRFIKGKKIDELGKLMKISHDGDRICNFNDFTAESESVPYFSKGKTRNICENPGGYRCSIPQIDYIIDFFLKEKNVLGAQISGAGLGGCAMVLIREYSKEDNVIEDLINNFKMQYKKKWKITPKIIISSPVAGVSILD